MSETTADVPPDTASDIVSGFTRGLSLPALAQEHSVPASTVESVVREHVKAVEAGESGDDPEPGDAAELLEALADKHREKDADYGSAWRRAGEILHGLSDGPIVLETPADCYRYGLFYHRLEKLSRAFNAEFNDHDPNNEAVRDSHEDASVYAAIHAETYGGGGE